jgi:MFS family permease
MLALLAVAELLGMSIWFAGSAVAPLLGVRWGLGAQEIGWLTSAVQLGFVVGTAAAAVLNLADLVPAHLLLAGSALLGAAANAGLAVAPGYGAALALRFATGFFLAGVYPPAMKMAATWFRSGRGLAIGTVVGALTVGKATPYLVHALPGHGIAAVVLTASAGAVLAALLVGLGYREGPYSFAPRPFSWGLVGEVVRERRWRLATGGYLGHMFELYSFWTWIPVFLSASAAARAAAGAASAAARIEASSAGGAGRTVVGVATSAVHAAHAAPANPPAAVSLAAFGTIAVGAVGCVAGGLIADRQGRERLVIAALAGSGACSLVIGALFGASLWLVAGLAWIWGILVIADSAQFSALVTESVPPHAVGTALAVQTSLGFLLTLVSIQLVPPLAAALGWRWAFPVLALGPACGIAAIRRLLRLKAASAGPRGGAG